jgi:hypothetical protein
VCTASNKTEAYIKDTKFITLDGSTIGNLGSINSYITFPDPDISEWKTLVCALGMRCVNEDKIKDMPYSSLC